MDWSKKLFLFVLILLGANTAMSRSPPAPPEQTLEESLVNSSVIVVKGIKFHWIVYGDAALGTKAKKVDGFETVNASKGGRVVLEAEVISFLHCDARCKQNRQKKVFITAGRFGMEDLVGLPLNQPLIFIYSSELLPTDTYYPPELLSGWHIRPRKAAVNPWPISERSKVEAALKKMHSTRQQPSIK